MVLAFAAETDWEVRQLDVKRLLLRAHNLLWDVWYMYPSTLQQKLTPTEANRCYCS